LSAIDPDRAQGRAHSLLRRDTADRWQRLAARIALSPAQASRMLPEYLATPDWLAEPGTNDLARELLEQAISGPQAVELRPMAAAILESPAPIDPNPADPRYALLLMLAERLSESLGLAGKTEQLDPQSTQQLQRLTESALAASGDQGAPVERRVAAIRWLACLPFEKSGELLASFIDIQQPQEVQRAAADGLARSADPHVADILLERYPALTPPLREQVITVLLARADRMSRLFDAIDAETVAAADVPPVRRSLLLKSPDAALRARAEQLFGSEATPAARRELIARYREMLNAPADASHGQVVFARECANCHRLGDAGYDVGPALVTVRARTPAEILEHVLDPNREVSPHYLDYVVLQRDGSIQTGAIAAETPTSITLRQPLGKQSTILRSEIDTVTSSGKSLMPEGLEQKVTPDEMRDLIEFVRTATR
jgi:putative heme-binding domain-containing protein